MITESFHIVRKTLGHSLLSAPEVKVPEWQSLDVSDKPMGITHELENVVFTCPIPETKADVVIEVEPNIPWAEEHFLERVSGEPLNPPPSAKNWPFAQAGHKDHVVDEKFSHTYPERMWPKDVDTFQFPNSPKEYFHYEVREGAPVQINGGVRFALGDLADVVRQLARSPMTRQAYLPIWFPEDTGAVHGERVPCSLGYHFRIRQERLHVTYFIRSCDFLRHFPDDVYMAMRLGQWVRNELAGGKVLADHRLEPYCAEMGDLTMHMISLHVFGGDMHKMRREYGTH